MASKWVAQNFWGGATLTSSQHYAGSNNKISKKKRKQKIGRTAKAPLSKWFHDDLQYQLEEEASRPVFVAT